MKNKVPDCRNWTDIAETKQISSWNYTITLKHNTNYRNWTKKSNCRSIKKDEIPDFVEAEDKISLKKK